MESICSESLSSGEAKDDVMVPIAAVGVLDGRSASPSLPSASAASLTPSLPSKLPNKSRWYVQPIPPFSGLASADSFPTDGSSGAARTVPHPARHSPLPQSSIKFNSKDPPVLALEPSPAALCSMEELPNAQFVGNSTGVIVEEEAFDLSPVVARDTTQEESNPITQIVPAVVSASSNSNPTPSATDTTVIEPAVVESPISTEALHSSDVLAPGKEKTLPVLRGAWAKKISLLASSHSTGNHSQPGHAVKETSASGLQTIPGVSIEEKDRFPWAAKMDPATRILYRATSPEYLEDGTPKVTIPSHVLLEGIENQKEYIVGQFYRCSPPPGGLIHAVLNRIWGRNCKIFIRKLGDSSYLFHIPDESTRALVLSRGLWHVDDCLMFVAPWTTADTLDIPEISTMPVWVTLKRIPNRLYSLSGVSHIASGLGAPMKTYKPRLDPTQMGEAKILVEVELSKAFPPKVAAVDKKGRMSMVDVEYAWIPSKCGNCGQLGHKASRCLEPKERVTKKAQAEDLVSRDVNTSTTLVSPTSQPALVQPMDSAPPTDHLVDTDKASTVEAASSQETHQVPIVESALSQETDLAALVVEVPAASVEEGVDNSTAVSQQNKVTTSPVDKVVQSKSESLAIGILGKSVRDANRFLALESLERDDESHDTNSESDVFDLMTPYGQRLLRDRPVKPTLKAMEMQASTARGRGKRGRGKKGGSGNRGGCG